MGDTVGCVRILPPSRKFLRVSPSDCPCESKVAGGSRVRTAIFVPRQRTEREKMRLALHRGRRVEEVLGSPRTCTTAQGMALRGLVPLNARINLGTTPLEWEKTQECSGCNSKEIRGILVGRQADHREILVGPTLSRSFLKERRGVHKNFPTYKKKERSCYVQIN